ncbi:MAG TPA: PqqD family protein [Thermoanaerobaculia bacterium]|nr:PqqD family protein [Thermoanaerobaculia bacterium]
MTLATRVTVPERVLFRDLAGEAVLLDLESGQYFGLNATGTRMWSLLAQHRQIEPALLCLLEEFDAPRERIQAEFLEFVGTLASRKLLELRDD